MPLTEKGEKIAKAMAEQYGKKHGKEVFYASRNAGTIKGVDGEPGSIAAPVAHAAITSAHAVKGVIKQASGASAKPAKQAADDDEPAYKPVNANMTPAKFNHEYSVKQRACETGTLAGGKKDLKR